MGPPSLLLHGFAGSARSFDLVLEALGNDRSHPVTLPGHAEVPPLDTERFDAVVDHLLDACRSTEWPQPPQLVGYSLGGRLGLAMLARAPELFAGGVLIGANPGLTTEPERQARLAADDRWISLLETQGMEAFVSLWERQPIFASQQRLPPDLQQRQREIRAGHDPHGLAWAMRTMGLGTMPDLRPRLSAIDLPMTLVAGAFDAKFRMLATEMADLLPRAEVVSLPDCGHNPLLESPGRVAELLAAR